MSDYDDDSAAPLWPKQLHSALQTTRSVDDLAADVDVSPDMATMILEQLSEAGRIKKTYVPSCPTSSMRLGEYESADELPDEFSCTFCKTGLHYLEDVLIHIQYTPLDEDWDPDTGEGEEG